LLLLQSTWLRIFSLVLLLPNLIGPWFFPVSPLLNVILVPALVTIAMTRWVMRRLVRLFAAWLYPKAIENQAKSPCADISS
jgi:antibiotic biosynthesis monooxygenase (ABM) superfamily enzyme